MNWVRVDCYEPNGGTEEPDDSCYSAPRRNCPLHRPIRQRKWADVAQLMRQDPSRILQQNSYGWSSMTLCLYHSAPTDIISEMLSLLPRPDQKTLLSSPVPNGSRLCLHFAARYATDVETVKLLAEAFPPALLIPSDDGIIPVDRAIYYRKDAKILHYLEKMTKQQRNREQLRYYNRTLRYTVILACQHAPPYKRLQQHPWRAPTGEGEDEHVVLVKELYDYCKEREMMGIVWNMLSYVGVQSIP